MSAFDWELEAVCRTTDPELWYPALGQSNEPAVAICRDLCPVRAECLEAAMAEEHPGNPRRVPRWGIRGAKTALERAALQRARTVRERAATTPTT